MAFAISSARSRPRASPRRRLRREKPRAAPQACIRVKAVERAPLRLGDARFAPATGGERGREGLAGPFGRAPRACVGPTPFRSASGPDKRQPRGMRVSVVSCHTERWDSPAAGRAAARRAGPSPAPAHRGPHGPRGRDAGGRPCLSVQDLPGNGFSPGRCLQLGTGCSAPPAPY